MTRLPETKNSTIWLGKNQILSEIADFGWRISDLKKLTDGRQGCIFPAPNLRSFS